MMITAPTLRLGFHDFDDFLYLLNEGFDPEGRGIVLVGSRRIKEGNKKTDIT